MTGSEPLQQAVVDYILGAEHLVLLAEQIDDDRWDGPGLGEWTLRSLVGHAGRSLTTVSEYLAKPVPEAVELDSTAAYYAATQGLADGPAVTERAVAAGMALGEDPVVGLRERLSRAAEALESVEDRAVATPFGAILLSDHLPTRTFELAVHGLDITRAIGVRLALPDRVLMSALTTAAATAVRIGAGERALLVLTGRESGPLSVV